MMHAIKQLVSGFATPLGLALIVALLGWLARACGARRLSAGLLVSSVAWAYLSATPPVATALLVPLETRYQPLQTAQAPALGHIVVLGSYYAPRDGYPVTSTLGLDGLTRIVEGVRLSRVFPEAKLVVSGGPVGGAQASADGYARLASELGVDPARLIVIDTPRDTKEEAAAVVKLLGAKQFALVTSASHMPRAMRLMVDAGARPLAAPTAHEADPSYAWTWRSLLPFASALRASEMAMHEYVGLLALSMGVQ